MSDEDKMEPIWCADFHPNVVSIWVGKQRGAYYLIRQKNGKRPTKTKIGKDITMAWAEYRGAVIQHIMQMPGMQLVA